MVTTDIVTVQAFPNLPVVRKFVLDNLDGPPFTPHINYRRLLRALDPERGFADVHKFGTQNLNLLFRLFQCPAVKDITFDSDKRCIGVELHHGFYWHEVQPYVIAVLEQFATGGVIDGIVEPLGETVDVRKHDIFGDGGATFVSTVPLCEYGSDGTIRTTLSSLEVLSADRECVKLTRNLFTVPEIERIEMDRFSVTIETGRTRFGLVGDEITSIVHRHVGFDPRQPRLRETDPAVIKQHSFIDDPSNWPYS